MSVNQRKKSTNIFACTAEAIAQLSSSCVLGLRDENIEEEEMRGVKDLTCLKSTLSGRVHPTTTAVTNG
jgi:hypothetical protein